MSQKQLFAWEFHSQAEVQSALEPIQPQLWNFIMQPWRELEQYRRTDPNFRHLTPAGVAQWLHYQIIGQVQGQYPPIDQAEEDEPGWFVGSGSIFHLCYRMAEMTFKKLDEDFQRSNAVTIHNDAYWSNAVLPGMPRQIKLIVGYQWTDETATAIRRIAIVCPSRREAPRWWYEIPAPPETLAHPTIAPPPHAPPGDSDKGFRVKGKRKKDAGKTGSDKVAES